jgi:hypothetical protein
MRRRAQRLVPAKPSRLRRQAAAYRGPGHLRLVKTGPEGTQLCY